MVGQQRNRLEARCSKMSSDIALAKGDIKRIDKRMEDNRTLLPGGSEL